MNLEELTRLYNLKEEELKNYYKISVGGLVNPFDKDVPIGWIQHKGSNLCMDIHCECGELHHIDSSFCYEIVTPCGRMYSVGATVPLFRIYEQTSAELKEAF